MTGPVTTEALVAELAEAMLRHEWPNSPLVPFAEQDEHIRNYWLGHAKAQIAGPLAPLLAALQQVTAERDEARAELARLRAEGEAKDRALKDLRADANALGARLGNTSQYDDPKVLRDLCWEAGNFLARRIVQPALTRSATAKEG